MRVSNSDFVRVPASPPGSISQAGGIRNTEAADHASFASPFARLMRGIGHELNRGEETMRSAVDSMRAGGDFAPSQLIALQAGVYRYSEAIDLASRVVDRTTSGIKTVLQGGSS